MCRFDPAATVTESWTMKVSSYCPTQNSLGGNTKNGQKYRGWRKAWEQHFGPWLGSLPPAKRKRRVLITRHYGKGKRAFDRVNFMGGCKPLLDTLTNFGALYDDNELWCEDHYSQQKSNDGIDYVTVVIEELA